MSREQVFDTEIKKFFDVSIKILENYQKAFITLDSVADNHILRNLQRYRIVYNMTDATIHIPYFQKLFRNYRDDILNVLKDDHWLRDENIVIQFGDELEDEELRKRSEKRKIEISGIYRCAIQLRKTVEESLKGLPDSAQEQSQELIYPEIFLLHMLRIFYSIYPQNTALQKNIQSLEKDLGITANQTKKGINPLFENLAENAKQIFGNVLPNNIKLPTNQEMSHKLEQAFKDPVVNETLGATVNNLINAKNLGEGLGAAIKSFENPKFMDGLLKAVQTLIPQETLDTIAKSTEQLKESGEIKSALNQLGLPTDIDISKMLKDGNGIEIIKKLAGSDSTNDSNENTSTKIEQICEDDICHLPQSEVPSTQTEQKQSSDTAVIGNTTVSITESQPITLDKTLQSLLQNIPSELTEMFSKLQTSNTEPKSLIDF